MGKSGFTPLENSVKAGSLVIRRLELSDVSDAYLSWLNNPEVVFMVEGLRGKVWNKSRLEHYVGRFSEHVSDLLLGIFLDGLHVGNITVTAVNIQHRSANIGILIGESNCWGKGIGSGSISMVKDFCFSRLKLIRLQAVALSINPGSIHAFKKAGFEEEGVKRCVQIINDKTVDAVVMSAINKELIKRISPYERNNID